jgi:hypothetical protein
MTALDVITLDQARTYLVVDYTDDDGDIKRAIETAVRWVENYTSHRLFERNETFDTEGCSTRLYEYPITVTGVVDSSDVSTDFTICKKITSIIVESHYGSSISATVGYSNVADVPSTLLSACYKIITYLYENRDAYGLSIPVDIQGLINQERRDASI